MAAQDPESKQIIRTQTLQCISSPYQKEVSNESNISEHDLVNFSQPTDLENPKDWSVIRKWIITYVLCATGFNRILVSTIMAPALPVIGTELHMETLEALMSMSVYLLATAVAPLVVAPLSEIYGRKPILHITNIWFLAWNLVCGFARNKQLLTAARALAGLGAGAAYMLSGSVLGDVWDAKHRGKSLGLSSLLQSLAAALGPIIGAVITENTDWRWIFWSTSLLQFVIVAVSILAYRETYAPLILQRRAKRLREETGNPRLVTAIEKLCENRSPQWILRRSLSRPIRLLLFHPIVMVQTLLSAFSYGITYLVITTYSDLWTSQYGESVSVSGLHYLAMCVGTVLCALIGGRLMDLTFRKLTKKAHGNWTPEFHLPLMLPGSILTILGLLWYGWAAQRRLFWLHLDAGNAVLAFGMGLMGMPLQAYIIDVYPEHASSAQAAAQLMRSLTAFSFPLFAPAMYSCLGYGWANTLLALVSLIISVPAPILIWMYGARLRSRSTTSF